MFFPNYFYCFINIFKCNNCSKFMIKIKEKKLNKNNFCMEMREEKLLRK